MSLTFVCPSCKSEKCITLNRMPRIGIVKRLYVCKNCGLKFKTVEELEVKPLAKSELKAAQKVTGPWYENYLEHIKTGK